VLRSLTRVPGWLVGSGVIAVGMGVMNLGTYGFTILAARLLGPSEYGALAAVMGLLLVVNVLSLGLQATGARRVAASPAELPHIEREIRSAGLRSAVALGVLCLAFTPLISSVLRLDSWATAALLAVSAVPLTVMGAQAGILQGERRWLPLALIYLAVGLGRIVFGGLALLVEPHSLGAMVGVTLGACAPAVVGWLALRHPARTHERRPPGVAVPAWTRGSLLKEVGHNSHALLAFFALSNADVVIARSILPDHLSGLYAGGLILAKAVLFLPQFVVVVAFPAMSAAGARRSTHLRGLALVLGIGVIATAASWALSAWAVLFVGGQAYRDLQPIIWGFAAVGTLLAMVQLMVYSVVARQRQRSVLLVWGALLVLVVGAAFVDTVAGLLVVVASVQTGLLGVLLLLSLRHPEPAPVDPVVEQVR
jgi:O-antigen/teichoic acid export membrane protein